MTHMNENEQYEQQRLAHCEYCGGHDEPCTECEQPMCEECYVSELKEAILP